MPTKAELEAEVERLKHANENLVRQVEGFDARLEEIGERAMELAEEHGWCGVISEALEEMAIPTPEREHEITIKIKANTTVVSSDVDQMVRESLLHPVSEWLDGDWSDVQLVKVSAEVMQ